MNINELENLSNRIVKRCMPEEGEGKVEDKQRFIELFAGIESSIGSLLYETVKIVLITSVATLTKETLHEWIRNKEEEKIKEVKERIKNVSLENLKSRGIGEDNAELIAIKIADAAEAEIKNLG
jgi:hypothetical protein